MRIVDIIKIIKKSGVKIVSKGLRRIEFEDLDYSLINKRDFHKMCQRINYRPFFNKLKEIGI